MSTTNPYLRGNEAISTASQGLGDWRHGAMARAMLRAYDERWGAQEWVTRHVEVQLDTPIYDPTTGRRLRGVRMAGKIDKICELDGESWIVDHKTTSSALDPDSLYWRQLEVDTQALHYVILAAANKLTTKNILWDVARKPSIKPKSLTVADVNMLIDRGLYCGVDVSGRLTDGTLSEIVRTGRENDVLYEARCYSWCKTNESLARRVVIRTNDQIREYAWDVVGEVRDLRDARRRGFWRKNPQACFTYGTPCQFLGICSGHDEPTSSNWKVAESPHAELDRAKGDLITHSRLSCFRLCPRKHEYRYERRLERVREQTSDALNFGNLWHVVMDAYWGGDS